MYFVFFYYNDETRRKLDVIQNKSNLYYNNDFEGVY